MRESKKNRNRRYFKNIMQLLGYAAATCLYFLILSQLRYYKLTDVEQIGILLATIIGLRKITK